MTKHSFSTRDLLRGQWAQGCCVDRGKILIVEDEKDARLALAELLRSEGYAVETAADGFKALPKLGTFDPDVLLSDIKMPGLDGVALLHRLHRTDPDRLIVIMTGFVGVDSAVAAMQAGAFDYVTKPIDVDRLLQVLAKAVAARRLRQSSHQPIPTSKQLLPGFVGKSPAMRALIEKIYIVAPTKANVLLLGESGTGKEMLAAALHHHSKRSQGPFVRVHCAALAESLLESELFGHERGAFTGATHRRDGRFHQAHRGTLFLDEIGEISPSTQVKLLRFLQERQFERVGSNQTETVDVRIIAATHKHLLQEVKQGRFREDLYYRLHVVPLKVPALKERIEDIGPLAHMFLHRFASENGKMITRFSDETLALLSEYPWPGNVREIENAIEHAVIFSQEDKIEVTDLPDYLQPQDHHQLKTPAIPGSKLAELERYAILRTMEHVGGSTSRAAEILGTSARKIQYKLQEYQQHYRFLGNHQPTQETLATPQHITLPNKTTHELPNEA